MEYITDEQGKWLIQGSARLLIEPSESYLAEMELEEQQRLEEEKNRPPTEIELLQQENKVLIAKVQANADLSDFHEELIVELAMEIYK